MTGRSRSRKPPSLDLSLSSREPSPDVAGGSSSSNNRNRRPTNPPPSASTTDSSSSPSTSISSNTTASASCPNPIPNMHVTGPYCFRPPTLSDVLSNTAPPPYTLSAFMAYLSQNHCLETLEFTMDASRYRKHYSSVANACRESASRPLTHQEQKDCANVRKLWQKLLDAYIVPNGPREVNLPCSIRDKILSIPNRRTPPPPEALDPAVNIVHELMQESVLVPFLSECQVANTFPTQEQYASENSHYHFSLPSLTSHHSAPSSHHMPSPLHQIACSFNHHQRHLTQSQPPQSSPNPPHSHHHQNQIPYRVSDENLGHLFSRRSKQQQQLSGRSASPPSPVDSSYSQTSFSTTTSTSSPAPTSHSSATSNSTTTSSRTVSPFSASLGWGAPRQQTPSNSWTGSNASKESMHHNADGSFSGNMTPPTTPPTGDLGLAARSGSGSRREGQGNGSNGGSAQSGWKRMTAGRGMWGFGKKKSETAGW